MNIDFNSFNESYNDFIKNISKQSIRKELNIPESDKLKRNGTFERWLYYSDDGILKKQRIKIQTFLWTSATGVKKYISAFPSFIIKYNKVSADLIEFISTNVGKDENVFNYIDDPECLVENEDILINACEKVDKACKTKGFTALINARYTKIFSTPMLITPISKVYSKTLRFKHTAMLLVAGEICFETGILNGLGLSILNVVFKFLR